MTRRDRFTVIIVLPRTHDARRRHRLAKGDVMNCRADIIAIIIAPPHQETKTKDYAGSGNMMIEDKHNT
eukprot:scaffold73934_cov21-Prasinocladus_malaysianus.AAC.1